MRVEGWMQGCCRALGAAMALLVLACPALAQNESPSASAPSPALAVESIDVVADEAQTRAVIEALKLGGAADGDPIQGWKNLVEAAPARQVGQPGNAAVDEAFKRIFADIVKTQNDPAAQRAADEATRSADAANAEAFKISQSLFRSVREEGRIDSEFWVAQTVEDPRALMALLVLMAVVTLASWKFQKRTGLMVLGVALLIGAVGLWVVAVSYETPAEAARKDPDQKKSATSEQVQEEAIAAGKRALEADRAAASALSGLWQTGRVYHVSSAFLPGEASMSVGGKNAKIYQMAPNLVDPGNLPPQGLSGPLVYAGVGALADMSGRRFEGAVVLMEFDCFRNWMDPIQLGASAIVFVEPENGRAMTSVQATQKWTPAPVCVPRYFVKRSELKDLIGANWRETLSGSGEAGQKPTATLAQKPGRWVRQRVASDWLLIPGTAKPKEKGTIADDPARQLVHIQTFKDSSSIVPELSPGGASAANLIAVMRLIEGWRKTAPERPVLVSVVNDHCNAMQGEQEFLTAAFADPTQVADEVTWFDSELAIQRFWKTMYSRELSNEYIEGMRDASETVGGKQLVIKKLITDRLQQQRNKVSLDATKVAFELNRIARAKKAGGAMIDPEDPDNKRPLGNEEELIAARKAMSAQIDDFNRVLSTFAKFTSKKVWFNDLSEQHKQLLRTTFAEQAGLAERNALEIARTREAIIENLKLRRRLIGLVSVPEKPEADTKPATAATMFAKRFVPVPVTAAFVIDLSFGSDRMAFFHMGTFRKEANEEVAAQLSQTLALQTVRVAGALEQETGTPTMLLDTLRGAGDGSPWQAYLGRPLAIGSEAWQAMELPGLTLTSARDARALEYTPDDVPARMNEKSARTILSFVQSYLPRLVNYEDLGLSRASSRKAPAAFSVEMSLKQADDFITGPPIDPVRHAVAVAQFSDQLSSLPTYGPMFGQVRPWPIFVSDVRGTFLAHGFWFRAASFHAFKYDPDFRTIQLSYDLGEGEKKAPSSLAQGITVRFLGQQLVLAELSKIDLFGLGDPNNQGLIQSIDVMDGVQGGIPRRYSVVGVPAAGAKKDTPRTSDGSASVFAMKESRVKLRVGASVAINATKEFPQGKGFASDTSAIRDLTLTSANDMWQLTDQRLAILTRKGVKNDAALAYSQSAETAIQTAQAELAAGDNLGSLVSSAQARGLSYRAYTRGLATINDLIKAVVIFLALVIPFCFFVTKLISPFTELNRQLAFFGGVFVVMAVILSIVHPAFDREIARTPEVIVLAFVMIGLAVFVSMVLVGRFNSAMNKVVEESLNSEGVDAPQGRLAGMAFLVGVNNMKRRRIRTTLTCVTIILVTFTMLSVISVGQNTEPVTNHVAPTAPYNGLLFIQPGLAPIEPLQMRRVRTIFDGQATIVCRAWAQRQGSYGEYLPYELTLAGAQSENTSPRVALQTRVLVGLDVKEDGFFAKMPLTAGSQWFSSNSAKEVVLSVRGAEILGLTPETFKGKRVNIQGGEYEVVGLVDDQNEDGQMKLLDAKGNPVKDLGGAGLLPILAKPSRDNKAAAAATVDGGSNDSSGGLIGGDDTQLARSRDIAFLPIDTAMATGEATYRMMSVKFTQPRGDKSPAAIAWESARDLVSYQDTRLMIGLTDPVPQGIGKQSVEPGQYSLTADSSTQVMGKLKIIIPIVLAATIIFNTMLGSVIERRREVAIYNAIGLNPSHVMMFFLAESFVFGIVGSVAGYLIGQGLSLVLSRFSSLALSLNYSSLSVMVVIFLTIGTVLLSTIYPAAMAAKAAVPSGQRRWSAPKPENDCIRVQFPFSYDAGRVLGVCAYLRDYMKQNSEASTGQFLAKVGVVGWVPVEPATDDPESSDPAHRRAYAMVFDVAPAPYDLGVNQKMEVYAYYDHRVRAHVLEVFLSRLSGQSANWVTVNQTFLESLRKRLLGWRSQRADTQTKYYRDGEQLFASANELPTVPSDGRAATKQERA